MTFKTSQKALFSCKLKIIIEYSSYLIHSKLPWDHSIISPPVTIVIKKNIDHPVVPNIMKFDKSKGKIKISSTSKIKNTKAIKKNWREKGRRLLLWGQNPHSKGEALEALSSLFFEHKNKILSSKSPITPLKNTCRYKISISYPISCGRLVH